MTGACRSSSAWNAASAFCGVWRARERFAAAAVGGRCDCELLCEVLPLCSVAFVIQPCPTKSSTRRPQTRFDGAENNAGSWLRQQPTTPPAASPVPVCSGPPRGANSGGLRKQRAETPAGMSLAERAHRLPNHGSLRCASGAPPVGRDRLFHARTGESDGNSLRARGCGDLLSAGPPIRLRAFPKVVVLVFPDRRNSEPRRAFYGGCRAGAGRRLGVNVLVWWRTGGVGGRMTPAALRRA